MKAIKKKVFTIIQIGGKYDIDGITKEDFEEEARK